jgi:hypothetical protein
MPPSIVPSKLRDELSRFEPRLGVYMTVKNSELCSTHSGVTCPPYSRCRRHRSAGAPRCEALTCRVRLPGVEWAASFSPASGKNTLPRVIGKRMDGL